MTTVTIHTYGGATLHANMSEADALLLVDRWSRAGGDEPDTVALHYTDRYGVQTISYVMLVAIAAIGYEMEGEEPVASHSEPPYLPPIAQPPQPGVRLPWVAKED